MNEQDNFPPKPFGFPRCEIVEIDVSRLVLKPAPLSYMVLFDPDIETVINLAAHSPHIFIFTFLTEPELLELDWTVLPKSNYIVKPIALVGLQYDNIRAVAHQIIEQAFQPLKPLTA